jgi:peptidylamidoglycolate lyase
MIGFMRIIRAISYLLALAAILVVIAYYTQPLKNGTGTDTQTRYELVNDWPRLPPGFSLGNPTGLGIDTQQNLIVFHRAGRTWPLFGMPEEPINDKTLLVIDKNSGAITDQWGEDLFIMPHGLSVDFNNNIWVTDVGLHQVFKFNHEGELLMELGQPRVSGNDSMHFNKPTDVAVAADGSFYVSDGYGNSRVVKFDSAGKYLFEWGSKGTGNGQFDIPHAIDLDKQGNVYVADRENNRIQVFTPEGKFIRAYTDESYGRIFSVVCRHTDSSLLAVDDYTFLNVRHRGSDVYIFNSSGEVRTRFGRSGETEYAVGWYHDITTDKEGNIYVGDILNNKILKFRKITP